MNDLYAARRTQQDLLIAALHQRSSDIAALLEEVSGEWVRDDLVYRFWHHSFKTYWLQEVTERIAALLESIAPTLPLHPWCREIVAAGTGHTFELSHNQAWVEHTGPIVAAFFHLHHLLHCAHRVATVPAVPEVLDPATATVFELYQVR